MKLALSLLLVASLETYPLTTNAAVLVDATLAAARQAAHQDRNAEAAQLFEQAVAAAPDRRVELLPELSDQLTYSGKSAEAIPLYREAIQSHTLSSDNDRRAKLGLALALSWNHQLPQARATYATITAENPLDVEALLGDARVLSWQDQLSPALREYEHVLSIEPGNREALDNIARVQNWRGRRRDAQRKARALLAKDAGDGSAALTLAQSEAWMGRPDLAARDDRAILHTHPNDSAALSLANDLADARKVQVQTTASVATQSDGLLIRNNDFFVETRGSHGLTSLGVHYDPISYIGQSSAGSATERRLGVYTRARLNDFSEINAAASNDEISSTGASAKNVLLYNTYLTLWPSDILRFDIGSRKETFDNLTSLRMGTTAVFNSASVDITPDENTRISARGYLGSFNDGNHQAYEQLEVERAVVRVPRLSIGAQATNYTFSQSLFNGYFDPSHYQSAELTTHLYGNARGRLYYDTSAAYGREWVVNGGARPTHALHGALSYVFSRDVSVSALYDSFDTRQISNGGFARTVLGLRLQSKW